MYRINKDINNISRIEESTFSDLGFREREHLQEWIAKNPDVLGEPDELLIIQKEFDGFNDTNERLDLLALNKQGDLVIIENKLDDTGRDVVWQALKYTSYCSTLSTSQVIKIYQDYLNKYASGENAKANIMEFIGVEQEDELLLNRHDQSIIFVANHYRKEVTSTVLWLLEHDINIKCFRASPYKMDNEVLLQIEQIIPLPETQQFMIDAKEKQKEEKGKSKAVLQSEAHLLKFWRALKEEMQNKGLNYVDNVTPNFYYDFGFRKGNGRFAMVIGRYAHRVELYFGRDEDKSLFDAMYQRKDELESAFHGEIVWERLEGKKASRIKYDMPKEVNNGLLPWTSSDEADAQRIEWFIKELDSFYKAAYPILATVKS
tara:strand:- start:128468 stop:129589 length:1122 start_codon:yes stop_codon:yes gene_type:complete